MEVLLERYLKGLVHIRSSGAAVEETSYYPILSDLLNGIGEHFKPPISCIMQIKNQGAGLPDGGLFTQDQLQTNPFIDLMSGPLPAARIQRGVLFDLSRLPKVRSEARRCIPQTW
jgi:hypothetical protein